MLLQVDMLKNLPVASMQDEAKIASVVDVVIHPETGELIGFWVQPEGWFQGRKALSSRDITNYDPHAIVVRNRDALVESAEIQPFQAAARRQDQWLGKRVQTEDGAVLGKVADLIINTDLEMLQKFRVTSLFGPERMMARDDIVKVTPKAIVVRASTESSTARQMAVEGATT